MSQPKVSIIVPVYNVEKYLERCINSLRNQTLEDIEIILVDDSSTDLSFEICNKAAIKDSRIKVIHKVNEGAGMARNAALRIATGEYIGFVDSDDYVEADMFKTLYEKAEEYNSDFVMSGVLYVDGIMFSDDGGCIRKDFFDHDTQFETKEELMDLRMGIVGSLPGDPEDSKYGMGIWKNLFKHDIIKKNHIEFVSERKYLSEDVMFMVDYVAYVKKATGIRDAFYNYCRNEESISKAYKSDRFEKSVAFIDAVESKLGEDIHPQEYRLYIDRIWQAMCRVACCQEIIHAADVHMKYKDLKKCLSVVCTHQRTINALKTYPISRLPFKQAVFAWGMKYKLYFILKILVKLRSK